MNESWYKKHMPQIKDYLSILPEISSNFKKIDGIDKVYVWGSFADNQSNPNYRIKDIDILVTSQFHSEDFIAINNETIKYANNIQMLEEDGFDPNTVKFSRDFLSYNKYNIDHWVISKDNHLLHWGPIFSTKEESDEITKDAEIYASEETGLNRNKLSTSSSEMCHNWYKTYNHFMEYYLNDMPSGWYQSDEKNILPILKGAIEI
jgi:predicted nucleotidyltransferase